jgi:glycine oxidase
MGRAADGPGVVVVGGGITGAFAAYFLARLGASVTLIERGEIGGQASGNNPGGLNPLHGPGIPGPMSELALASFRLHVESWEDVHRLSGIDFRPRLTPRIQLAFDERDREELGRAKELHDTTPGFAAVWVGADELLAAEPRLSSAVVGGLRTEGNARVDAGEYTRALVGAAVELGAAAVRGDVRGLRERGKRVTGVVLDSGSVRCDGVVIATGPWCAEPAGWLGMALPVEPVKGEMLLVHAGFGGIETDLAWRDTAVYGTDGDEVWLGGTEERAGFDGAPTVAGRASILARVAQFLHGAELVRVVEQTAGLRPVTPDAMPIAGLADGWENVCLALGGGRKGVLLSSGLGRAAAELLVEGGTRLPLEACSPARWNVANGR